MAKKTPPPDALTAALIAAINGPKIHRNPDYVGKKLYGRKGTSSARIAGTITNTSMCRLEGCRGLRLHVRWPDGHRTYVCTKDCDQRKDGHYQLSEQK